MHRFTRVILALVMALTVAAGQAGSAAAYTHNGSYYGGAINDAELSTCYESGTPVYSGRAGLNNGARYWVYAINNWVITSLGACSSLTTGANLIVKWDPIGPCADRHAGVSTSSGPHTYKVIVFNSNCGSTYFHWGDVGTDTPAGKIAASSVMAHEVGHALGLGHSQASTRDQMDAYYHCGFGYRPYPITDDDAAGIRARYPAFAGGNPNANPPTNLICAP